MRGAYHSALADCLYLVSILKAIFEFLNDCPFDCTNASGNGTVGPLNIKLNTTVGTLLSRYVTVRSRCVIVVCSNVFLVCMFNFDLYCLSFSGVCETTASDIFPLITNNIDISWKKSMFLEDSPRKSPWSVVSCFTRRHNAPSNDVTGKEAQNWCKKCYVTCVLLQNLLNGFVKGRVMW